jgi:hypothetical protein
MCEPEQDGPDLLLFYHPLLHGQGQEPLGTLREPAGGLVGVKRRKSSENRTRRTRIDQVVGDLARMALRSKVSQESDVEG